MAAVSPSGPSVGDEADAKILLGVLDAIERNHHVTQRSVANELGIALGLANAYVKRCVRKGLVKIQQVPTKRYAYYLTPMGFAEKSQLTARYLTESLSFFRRARSQCAAAFAAAEAAGHARVVLLGQSDLTEIAILCARECQLEVVGILVSDAGGGRRMLGLPVTDTLDGLGRIDAAIVTDLAKPQQTFEQWAAVLGADRIFSPEFLRIQRAASGPAGGA